MREARFDAVESDRKQVSRFSQWSSIILMAAILAVAGIVSALTAMRFAIRGREVAVPPLAGKTAEENSQSQWFAVEGVNFTLQFESAGRTYSGSDSAFRKPAQN